MSCDAKEGLEYIANYCKITYGKSPIASKASCLEPSKNSMTSSVKSFSSTPLDLLTIAISAGSYIFPSSITNKQTDKQIKLVI